jgi:hypothetical protein
MATAGASKSARTSIGSQSAQSGSLQTFAPTSPMEMGIIVSLSVFWLVVFGNHVISYVWGWGQQG